MKSRYTALVIAGAVVVSACAESPTTNAPASLTRHGSIAFNADAAADENTYLVSFKGNAVPDDFAATVATLGGEVIFAHAGAGIGAVSGLSTAAAQGLAAHAQIAAVEPDVYTVLDNPDGLALADDAVLSPSNPTTAAFYIAQWHHMQIKAPAAWAAGKLGDSRVRVGILDTGLGYLHQDLVGRVDLAASVSFLNAAENARVQAAFPGAHPVADLHYHGTHVGATVASNAIRAAGVTSKTTLVGIKVCAPGNPGTTPANHFVASCPISAVLAGVLYATDIDLPVINMSLGGLFLRRQASAAGGFGPSLLAIFNSVFHYAYKNGTTVVVASGNNGANLQAFGLGLYGAYCDAPGVICVSATGPTAAGSIIGPWTNPDAVTSYSNIGKSHITVAAPGGTGAGFVFAACSNFSLVFNCLSGQGVLSSTGTSMAAPHVAGLAALIAAEGVQTPAAITQRIIDNADDLGPKGKDDGYGHGRINVARALGLQ